MLMIGLDKPTQGWSAWPFVAAGQVTFAALLLAVTSAAFGDERRAKTNYMLYCQGCHLPAAQGLGSQVPKMNGFVGYFTHSDEGRRFLIQVPGSATAPVNDEQLTELMNWILQTYSGDQLVEGFEPYTVSEVSQLRLSPDPDPAGRRQAILSELALSNKDLKRELAQ